MTGHRPQSGVHALRRGLVPFAASLACLVAGCGSSETATPARATTAAPTVQATTTPPATLPFADGREVDTEAFFAALRAELPTLEASAAVRDDWARLRKAHDLADDPALYADFVRVRLAFEATRAGGLWGLEWRITDQEPRSDRVWAQWRDAPPSDRLPLYTAIAECDELSALFAVVAHGLGLSPRSRTGLFWPTANHTVAVWAFPGAGGREIRVVVPTSQIFLDGEQGLDTRAFDPWTQPRLYDYRGQDAAKFRLPAPLARQFVAEARRSGTLSGGALQALRNRREYDQRVAASAGREH